MTAEELASVARRYADHGLCGDAETRLWQAAAALRTLGAPAAQGGVLGDVHSGVLATATAPAAALPAAAPAAAPSAAAKPAPTPIPAREPESAPVACVLVKFDAFSAKFNEIIPIDSQRLKPHGSMTSLGLL